MRDSRTFEGRLWCAEQDDGGIHVGTGAPGAWVQDVIWKAARAHQGARPVRVYVTVEVEPGEVGR